MRQISHSTCTVERAEKIIATDEDGNEIAEWMVVSEKGLEIKVAHKDITEMAVVHGFTPCQNEQFALLANPKYDALWMVLLSGYADDEDSLSNQTPIRWGQAYSHGCFHLVTEKIHSLER